MAESYTNLYILEFVMCTVKRAAIVSVLIVLSACSVYQTDDEGSTYYAVPVGSRIVLNQEVTIAGDQVATYAQNGELMSYGAVNKYYPNCKFEIYTMSEQPRTVAADTFEIIRVVDEIESSSVQESTQLAVRDTALVYGMLDRSYIFNYATMMYLRSEKQKDVYRMTCQLWDDLNQGRHLTIAQMRKAMGEVFTLVIDKD